jgi:hypothetical protein
MVTVARSRSLGFFFSIAVVIPVLFVAVPNAQAGYQYESQFGSFGSGDGQFNGVFGITLDLSDNVFVTDNSNARIQKFNSSGVYQSKFGSNGSGNGQFNSPIDVAIDSLGNIFTLEGNGLRVQKFNSSGVYQSKFGSSGFGNGQFRASRGIALDSSDNIYVTDSDINRVQKFNSSGVYQSQFGSTGSGDGQFNGARGIEVDSTGNVYVTDYVNNRVQKFNSSGVYQLQFGSTGSGNGQFNSPVTIAVDSLDNVYVVDQNNSRIQKFNSSGVYQSQFGREGSGDGEFRTPYGIAFDSLDNIYITDLERNIVEKFVYVPVTVSTFYLSVTEGQQATYTAVLDSQPTDDVTVTLTPTTPGSGPDVTVSPLVLTFTDQNWNVPQTVTVDAGDDTSYQEGRSITISGAVASNDTDFDGIVLGDVTVDVVDDEPIPGISNSSGGYLNVTEGEQDTYTLMLSSEPIEDVIVTLSTTTPVSGSGATVSPSLLTFTPLNWDTEQVVTVTTINDGTYDELRSVTVSSSLSSGDPDYDGISVSDVSVEITDDDTVGIATCTELQAMADNLDYPYSLDNDVDCAGFDPDEDGKGFIPVGNSSTPFTGSFNGNGHTISNLTIARPDENYVGLFGYVDGGMGATFQNVTIAGVIEGLGSTGGLIGYQTGPVSLDNITSDITLTIHGSYAGGLIGDAGGYTTITDSTVSGSITLPAYAGSIDYVGGLVGYASNEMDMSNNSVTGDLSITADDVESIGGLVGYSDGGTIESSRVTGTLTINSSGDVEYGVGGLVGYANDAMTITDSFVSGDITVTAGTYVDYGIGGLVGFSYGGSITSSYTTGNLTVTSGYYVYEGVGGLVGYNDDVLDITTSYATGDITVTADSYVEYGVGGLIGYYYYGGTIDRSYSTGNITVNAGDYVEYGVGGLYGYNGDGVTITNSFSQGDISVTSDTSSIYSVGGLFGYNDGYTVTVENSYATGGITLNASTEIREAGGLAGLTDASDSITNSFSAGALSLTSGTESISSAGAFMGDNGGATVTNNFYDKTASTLTLCTGVDDPDPSGCTAIENNTSYFLGNSTSAPLDAWDFDAVWEIVSGNYPILRDLPSPYPSIAPELEPEPTSHTSGSSSLSPAQVAQIIAPKVPDPRVCQAGHLFNILTGARCSTTITPPALPGTFFPPGVAPSLLPLSHYLSLGSRGPDVYTLQKLLNSLGFTITQTGPGSPGNETDYFGGLTKAAVIKYQRAKGIDPIGVVGPVTRAALNSGK